LKVKGLGLINVIELWEVGIEKIALEENRFVFKVFSMIEVQAVSGVG